MTDSNILPIIISAMVALLVLLGFVNVMINSKKTSSPQQALECRYQHEVISAKMTRTEANIEKMSAHMADIAVILKDHTKTAERFHGELINALRDHK